MSIEIENQPNKPQNGRVIGGMILLLVGVVFLLQQMRVMFLADWVISWQMGLIVWGIFIGARHNFRNSGWLIMVLIGAVFLANDIFPRFDVWDFTWPIAIIVFGIWLILRRNQPWDEEKWKRKWDRKWERKWNRYNYKYSDKFGSTYNYGNTYDPAAPPVTPVEPVTPENPTGGTDVPPTSSGGFVNFGQTGDDVLDTVSVFGNVVKTVFSKNFRGGDVVNIFGGTELDLTQADINGRVVIDIVQIFGGSKIIVPSNWQVVSDTAAVFAGIDDKRIKSGVIQDNNKILVIKGVSIFAGIDIRSY
jgi:predicted membrane protein